MATRGIITNKGLQLLASSSQATGQYWWVGYYALAFVPNFWKEEEVELPEYIYCDNVNGEPNVEVDDTDQITPNMTHLTKNGDMIYNIFQGNLNGTGFYNCVSDGSPGGDFFGLAMYNKSIKKHYRYVLDKNGNNTLVTWVDDPDDETGKLKGANIYLGTDGFVKGELPIPAPLYYLGDQLNSVDDYFPKYEDEETNGADIYPYLYLYLEPDNLYIAESLNFPKVSVDYREYNDSQGNDETKVYDETSRNPTNDGAFSSRTSGGEFFNTLEIPAVVDPIPLGGFDTTSWYAANLTLLPDYGESDNATICKEFWKALSISNYNKEHAPANSVGGIYGDSDIASRNIATVTKLFPISNYKVINTESGTNSNGESLEVATAISIQVNLDLVTETKENSGIEEAYDNINHPTDQTYHDETSEIITDQNGNNIYNTSHVSFKFNRIGIYAVPLAKCPTCFKCDDPSGENTEVQFEIDPDTEPILFAVADWDNTQVLDETGNGMSSFLAEFNINLESPVGNLDADALVRHSAIFYNLYSDDAITWYKNQLVATASTQNAITELGLEVQHLKKGADCSCCPPPDLTNKFAAKNHSHTALKNLKDGQAAGSLRGINTLTENIEITIQENAFKTEEEEKIENYSMGNNSVVLGGDYNYVHESTNSFVANGVRNSIYGSETSGIFVGSDNILGDVVTNSMIGSGKYNRIAFSDSCFIGSGESNRIIPFEDSPSINSAIVTGKESSIEQSERSIIGGGLLNYIIKSFNSGIFSGKEHIIYDSYDCFIGGGFQNYIGNASGSSINGGLYNYINSPLYASIVGGRDNYIDSYGYYATGIGRGTAIYNYGEFAQASGEFEFKGDAQRTHLVLRGKTDGDETKRLALDGSTTYFKLDRKFNEKYGSFSGITKITGHVEARNLTISSIETLNNDADINIITSTAHNLAVGQRVMLKAISPFDIFNRIYEVSTTPSNFDITLYEDSAYSVTASNTLDPGTLKVFPISFLKAQLFSGWFDGTEEGNGISYIKAENVDSLYESPLTSSPFNEAGIKIDVDEEDLFVQVRGTEDENINWVADIDMDEIGIEP